MRANEVLLQAIGDVDPALVQAAWSMNGHTSHRSGRRLVTIFIAAVLALALATTAYAYFGAADWFKSWFAGRSETELTPGQQAYIENTAVGVGQSVTQNGWTVTLAYAMADQYNYYIKLDVEAPEGTVLSGEDSFDFGSRELNTADGALWRVVSGSSDSTTILADEAGRDNALGVLWVKHVTAIPNSDFSFTDGTVKTLVLEDFRRDRTVLAEGVWRFDFIFTDSAQDAVELVADPVACEGFRTYRDGEGMVKEYVDMTVLYF